MQEVDDSVSDFGGRNPADSQAETDDAPHFFRVIESQVRSEQEIAEQIGQLSSDSRVDLS